MTDTHPSTGLTLEARNATLQDLAGILKEQRAHALDVVAPAVQVRSRNGAIMVPGTGAVTLSGDGVTTGTGSFRPLATFDSGIADKLGIPLRYVRWMRENRPDLYDSNVNGLLHGKTGKDGTTVYPPDQRKFLLRLFRGGGDGGGPGIARAFLSDSYKPIDNLDVLMALLSGVQKAREDGELSADPEIRNLNLTPDRMHVRVTVPEIAALAPKFAKGYRNPFRDGGAHRADGWRPSAHPKPRRGDVVWAGLDFTNNEIGDGAAKLTPMVLVCVCDNGQVCPQEAMKVVHLGTKLDEGVINWSDDTRRKNLELVIAKTRDAVRTFLSRQFLESMVAKLEERADAPVSDPAATIKVVARKCVFTDAEAAMILEHFTLGGQLTAAGVANAVTSAAQTVPNAGQALDMEYKAMAAMEAAAALAAA